MLAKNTCQAVVFLVLIIFFFNITHSYYIGFFRVKSNIILSSNMVKNYFVEEQKHYGLDNVFC